MGVSPKSTYSSYHTDPDRRRLAGRLLNRNGRLPEISHEGGIDFQFGPTTPHTYSTMPHYGGNLPYAYLSFLPYPIVGLPAGKNSRRGTTCRRSYSPESK